GISLTDLSTDLKLPSGREAYYKDSNEHAVASSISGILRHSGSRIPPEAKRPSAHNGLNCMVDTGGSSSGQGRALRL
ncbi:MAG: hypothetical protein ACKPKO_01320, partial [Candidatus Fonsibacter sp.]